jgi:hypothetical protein
MIYQNDICLDYDSPLVQFEDNHLQQVNSKRVQLLLGPDANRKYRFHILKKRKMNKLYIIQH